MDSPHLQSSSQLQRNRTNSNLSVHSIDHYGGVRKRSFDRDRSISTSHVDRLQQLVLNQSDQASFQTVPATSGIQWITPQHSPQPQNLFTEASASVEPFPAWSVPTPPRSDSGVPTVSIDATEEAAAGISAPEDFIFDQPTTSAEMSSLGLLLPSQYGGSIYDQEPSNYTTMEQNYIPPVKVSQPAATTGASAYTQTVSSSPALYQSRTAPEPRTTSRRHSELPSNASDTSYAQSFRRISTPYDTASTAPYTATTSTTIPSISGLTQSPVPSPHMNSTPSLAPYSQSMSRSPGLYDGQMYQQSYTTSPASTQLYAPSQSLSYPPPFVGSTVNEVLAKPLGSDASIRVLNQRPKPQCWEHGCNGRQFSTFSNLLRHQREKSGTAPKSYCPKCGAEFTRTTARNGHLAHDKCTKQRRPSDDK